MFSSHICRSKPHVNKAFETFLYSSIYIQDPRKYLHGCVNNKVKYWKTESKFYFKVPYVEVKGKTYYILEYAVTLPNQLRHNLATVVISRGKLFTFNASTTDKRWSKMQNILKEAIESFNVA